MSASNCNTHALKHRISLQKNCEIEEIESQLLIERHCKSLGRLESEDNAIK